MEREALFWQQQVGLRAMCVLLPFCPLGYSATLLLDIQWLVRIVRRSEGTWSTYVAYLPPIFFIWGRKRHSIGTKGNQQLFLFLVCNKIFFDKRYMWTLLSAKVWVPGGYSGTLTLQIRIWNGHGLFFFFLLFFPSLPCLAFYVSQTSNSMGSSFLYFGFAFAAALSPGNSAKQRDSDHVAEAALGLPGWLFGFAARQGWSSSWWAVETWATASPLHCPECQNISLQPTFPLLVPQWSSKLKFKVVLALEILVAVSQVTDKAQVQRKQVLFKIIYLQWPVHFGNVYVRRK